MQGAPSSIYRRPSPSTKSECGFCKKGYDGPSGRATTWEPNAAIHKGKISGVTTRNGIRYEVDYKSIEEHEIFTKKEDADIERKKIYKREVERSELWFRESFIRAKENQIWSAGYHKRCIKSTQKTIDWHEARLGMIKDKVGKTGTK